MKRRYSDRTIQRVLHPKQKQVTRESFKLVRSDSHIVSESVPGYTVEIEGVHFLLEKALVRFPSLMIAECPSCRELKERVSRGESVGLRDTLEHY